LPSFSDLIKCLKVFIKQIKFFVYIENNYTSLYTIYTMFFNLSDTDKRAFQLIRNSLIHKGVKPTLREINVVTGGKSPRSASIVIDRLIRMGLLKKNGNNLRLTENPVLNPVSIETVNVPLVGTVTCGIPMLAVENIEAIIPVSTRLAKKGSTYFLLRASGNSMNQAGINDKDILLVKQQSTANDGDKVVALIDDEATVKILERRNGNVILRPKSSEKKYKPIILSDNCQIQGVVVAILPSDLN
jgi:repressor LexA